MLALFDDNPIVLFSLLMVGVNGIIAVLLPYSAENYPILVRGRGTGLVAGAASSAASQPTPLRSPLWRRG